METTKLKRFAQYARRSLIEQVSSKLKLVLAEDSAARRESVQAIKKLESAIHDDGKDQVIERVAYIWFNRFCALRFMDVNRYNRVGIVSPADPGQFQPEILAEAKMGQVDDEMLHGKIRQQIFALLDGKAPSRDPQGEAYRLLVVAACNYWNKAMPFLFQRIDDYTELLMPDDLLSGNSILAYTREAMTPDVCEDVEVIGWLYQFYISEKKDEVFNGLKKNKKITPENIPSATQLFTPHWIVRYLVENSLGRLWLLNRPNSPLKEKMPYFITTEHTENEKNNSVSSFCSVVEKDFLVVNSPEEIKICDPACGSGHMLTYAFDLLYAIYEEEGYEPAEIPEKILTHNLYGVEIDERAGELAAFALTMKARAKQRRFFNKEVKPNICVLENVHFYEDELNEYMNFVGRDLFTLGLENTLRQFEEADNFGSLIRPDVTDVDGMLQILESKNVSGHLFLSLTHQKVLQALRQADYLSPKYHVVIANPPYMGAKGMNGRLKTWAKDQYPNSKADLFAMFIERALEMPLPKGMIAMITMEVWMFLTSYTNLRRSLLNASTLQRLIHLPYEGKAPTAMGISFGVCAFVKKRHRNDKNNGSYSRLRYFDLNKDGTPKMLEKIINPEFWKDQHSFSLIPGSTIAFDATDKSIDLFNLTPISKEFSSGGRCKTSNDEVFLRRLWEVSATKVGVDNRWCLLSKGGDFRRYFGNIDTVIRWDEEAKREYSSKGGLTRPEFWEKSGITWTIVSSKGAYAFRLKDGGTQYNSVSPTIFGKNVEFALAYLNSTVASNELKIIAPTLAANVGEVLNLPFRPQVVTDIKERATTLIASSRADWDSYETSWDFTSLPLLNPDYRQLALKASYQKLRAHWREMTLEMQRLEEENNRIFIEAYSLQDELTPEVPLNEITLTCNPHYRYGGGKTEEELESLLLADTMRELVSYAVGCMFGRYALDKPGLILANQGETTEDFYKKIGTTEYTENTEEKNINKNSVSSVCSVIKNSFPPDDDNVIPMLDGDWFTDDIAERFRKFLRVAFGEEHYEENLQFIEQALNVKNKREYTLRDYFLGEFYTDHIKRYKKRPIYWLFSSPKGSFNALIYMHRYRPDTVSVVLNDYLREFRTKLTAHKNHLEAVSISASATQGEKTKALKEIEKINKMIAELEEYEREVLYPLATQQIEIDLDDGVKANYPKFGEALKKIPGLAAKDEE